MKRSIQLLTATIDNAFHHLNSSQNFSNLFNQSPVRALKLIPQLQRHNEAVQPTTYSAMELALQAADRDHKEVLRRYNQSKQLRAVEEAAAA